MKSVADRNRLVEQATQFAAQTGLANMTLRPLATAIGTSDRMLLYYFGSKESLVGEILEHVFDAWAQQVEPISESSLAGFIVRLYTQLTDRKRAYAVRLYLEAVGLAVNDAELRRVIQPMMERHLQRVSGWLKNAGARASDLAQTTRIVSGAIDGLLLYHYLEPNDTAVPEAVRSFAAAVEMLWSDSADVSEV